MKLVPTTESLQGVKVSSHTDRRKYDWLGSPYFRPALYKDTLFPLVLLFRHSSPSQSLQIGRSTRVSPTRCFTAYSRLPDRIYTLLPLLQP